MGGSHEQLWDGEEVAWWSHGCAVGEECGKAHPQASDGWGADVRLLPVSLRLEDRPSVRRNSKHLFLAGACTSVLAGAERVPGRRDRLRDRSRLFLGQTGGGVEQPLCVQNPLPCVSLSRRAGRLRHPLRPRTGQAQRGEEGRHLAPCSADAVPGRGWGSV